jgi:hypothetical protein
MAQRLEEKPRGKNMASGPRADYGLLTFPPFFFSVVFLQA